MSSRERLRSLGASVSSRLAPARRPVTMAAASVLVCAAVLLALDSALPYPSPSERMLYRSASWSLLFGHAEYEQPRGEAPAAGSASSIGGYSYAPTPLSIMLYRAKPGDTITGIAQKLGLNADTLSSLNRTEGRGVHNLVVGEQIKIPNQDGIYLAVNGNLEDLCTKYDLSVEDVLAVNSIALPEVEPGSTLFFPGVQHTGYEYSLSLGVAVLNPLRSGWQSSAFGYRTDPFTGGSSKHRGIDIAAAEGTAVKSASDGLVSRAGWDEVLGNYVEVRAPRGYSYIYGHMSELRARAGATVAQGQVIGKVGSTGRATGPHLHFEVRKNGVPQNPRLFISGIR